MFNGFFKSFITIAFVFLAVVCASAQGEASTADGRAPSKEDFPKSIKESLEKQRIEKEKKEHDQMIERGEEALKLSGELEKSVEVNNKLSANDQAKLTRIEKIIKKIRRELGGDDDESAAQVVENDDAEEISEKPSTVAIAVKKLQSTATRLVDELKKTTRFTVSVVAIQSSNSVLRILRFIRFSK